MSKRRPRASDKEPPLTATDYYQASEDRFAEAKRLFEKGEKETKPHYWIGIIFLSVVAVECLLTAFLLKENDDAELVTSHNIERYIELIKGTRLIDIEHVDKELGEIHTYWEPWQQDLRYLSADAFISRVIYNNDNGDTIVSEDEVTIAPELIGNIVYDAASVIVRAGEYQWKKHGII